MQTYDNLCTALCTEGGSNFTPGTKKESFISQRSHLKEKNFIINLEDNPAPLLSGKMQWKHQRINHRVRKKPVTHEISGVRSIPQNNA